MSQSLCHAGAGLALPNLHIDIQRWDFQRADTSVLALHPINAGMRGNAQYRRGGCCRNIIESARDTVLAGNGSSGILLQAGQIPLLHNADLRCAGHTVGQFGDLIVRKIRATIVVCSAIHNLVRGGGIVFRVLLCLNTVFHGKGTDRQCSHRHEHQCQSSQSSNMLHSVSSSEKLAPSSSASAWAARCRRTYDAYTMPKITAAPIAAPTISTNQFAAKKLPTLDST